MSKTDERLEALRKQVHLLSDKQRQAELLRAAAANFGSQEEIARRFKIGSHGYHELADRSWIQYENWQTYVAKHPAQIFVDEAATLAHIIEELMFVYYQLVATATLHGPGQGSGLYGGKAGEK